MVEYEIGAGIAARKSESRRPDFPLTKAGNVSRMI